MNISFDLYEGRKYPLLPGYSKPFDNELLSSWLTRMAIDHKLSILTFTRRLWPEYRLYANDIDLLVSDDFLYQLAIQTNCTTQQVKQTTLESINENIGGMRSLFVLPSVKLGSNPKRIWQSLMYCGSCLQKEIPYFRKTWRLSIFIICPDCGCYLQDYCPWCGAFISFSRNALKIIDADCITLCHACGKDLQMTKCKSAPDELVNLQRIIVELLDEKKAKKHPESLLFVLYRVMSQLRNPLGKYRQWQKDIYTHLKIPYEPTKGKMYRFDLLTLQDRIHAMTAAYWLLEDWPERFIHFSKKHQISLKYSSRWRNDPPRWFSKIVNLECNEFTQLFS